MAQFCHFRFQPEFDNNDIAEASTTAGSEYRRWLCYSMFYYRSGTAMTLFYRGNVQQKSDELLICLLFDNISEHFNFSVFLVPKQSSADGITDGPEELLLLEARRFELQFANIERSRLAFSANSRLNGHYVQVFLRGCVNFGCGCGLDHI